MPVYFLDAIIKNITQIFQWKYHIIQIDTRVFDVLNM